MQHVSGLVPTNQEVVRLKPEPYPYCYRSVRFTPQRLARRGFLAGLLLLGAFFLLFWVEGVDGSRRDYSESQMVSESLIHVPIETVATMVGYTPAEAVRLLWERGIRITGSEQTIVEIAEGNDKKSSEILAILSDSDHADRSVIN
ncbi:MAG: hypothetical protein AB7U29_10210 [Desulfobulbus sp.]